MIGEAGGFDAVALQKYHWVERIDHVHHAGNSSGIVDGAALVLVGSERRGRRGRAHAARPDRRPPRSPAPTRRSCSPARRPPAARRWPRPGSPSTTSTSSRSTRRSPRSRCGSCASMGVPPREGQRQRRRDRHGPPARRHRGDDPRHRWSTSWNAATCATAWPPCASAAAWASRRSWSGSDGRQRQSAGSAATGTDRHRGRHPRRPRAQREHDERGVPRRRWPRSLDGLAAAKAELARRDRHLGQEDLLRRRRPGRRSSGRPGRRGRGRSTHVTRIKGQLRRLETLGMPVVAAMNGTALGGGLEIALACHHRIGARRAGRGLRAARGDPRACCPAAAASPGSPGCSASPTRFMKVLRQGQRHSPPTALEIGIVDELAATPEEMLAKARAWIAGQPARPRAALGRTAATGSPAARRRRPKLAADAARVPGQPAQAAQGRPAARRRATSWPRPSRAPRSTSTPRCASRAATSSSWSCGQVAKNMIKAFFFDLQRDQRRRLAAGRVRRGTRRARSPCSAPG